MYEHICMHSLLFATSPKPEENARKLRPTGLRPGDSTVQHSLACEASNNPKRR